MNSRLFLPTHSKRTPDVVETDRDVRGDVEKALRVTGYSQLHDVEVLVHEGLVTLKGRVSTYYLKQVAQAAAMLVSDKNSVKNDIVVDEHPARGFVAGHR